MRALKLACAGVAAFFLITTATAAWAHPPAGAAVGGAAAFSGFLLNQAGGGVQWTQGSSGLGGTLISWGDTASSFIFAGLNAVPATLSVNISAPANDAAVLGGYTASGETYYDMFGMSGSISYQYTGLKPVRFDGGSIYTGGDLFTIDFNNADMRVYTYAGLYEGLSVGEGQTKGHPQPSGLYYKSDLLHILQNDPDAYFNLSPFEWALPPSPYSPGLAFNDFTVEQQTQDQETIFTFYSSAAVPEPEVWAFMVLGLAVTGVAMRRVRSIA